MKLHELKPAEGSRVMVKHPDGDKKDKKLVQLVDYVEDLNVDKHHCSCVYQNVDSQT